MLQLSTALDAQPMTDANAKPRMASDIEAMTAAYQLPPATDSLPIVAIGAFRQGAWVRRSPRLLNDGADLFPEWHRYDQALGLAPDGLQTTYPVQLPAMRQYGAKTYHHATECIVVTPLKGLPRVGLPKKAIKGDKSYTLTTRTGTEEDVALGWKDVYELRDISFSESAPAVSCSWSANKAKPKVPYTSPFLKCSQQVGCYPAWALLSSQRVQV